MRIVRFQFLKPDGGRDGGQGRIGVLLGNGDSGNDRIIDVSAIAQARGHEVGGADLAWWDTDGPLSPVLRAAAADGSARTVPLADVRLRAPVARPGKVMCIGLNYRDHAVESGMEIPKSPIMFAKFGTSIAGPGDDVVIPPGSEKTDYEAEMAIVIGKRARNVGRAEAQSHVLGYACFNDISARDFQFADGQWIRGKAADTFAPIGPFVATADEIPDAGALRVRLRLNGATMQDSSTTQLIFGVAEIVAFLSRSMTLEPGDVIATGTPPGVGFARKPPVFLKDGDRMEVEIEGLGVLANTVRSSS
jgi:2-keto-4-pentenoate hydratase/2-oxohepta-3-ene-1,7-dioic acid hydratase in catechol pathway